MVDPGYAGTDPKAITQATVDAFYDDDKDVSYWDTSEAGEASQIIYSLYYGDNGFDVVPVAWEAGTNNPITWIVTANLVKVTLGEFSESRPRFYLGQIRNLVYNLTWCREECWQRPGTSNSIYSGI